MPSPFTDFALPSNELRETMFDYNNETALGSIKFPATGFKSSQQRPRKLAYVLFNNEPSPLEQRLRRHGEMPNHYFTVDTTVKNLRETTKAFTIPQLSVL
ncbi:hypothetical protein GJ744_004807 [Endocarpon pusillum]|uniref:Uncharacterized protein n=1 Tax=Endocarpon pusillum TaxID=364733 RepID=A0A8H7E1F1_9EURO|nr:hypothetical protein GJ744_004807 [Endocarpon pusillum]